MLQKLRGRGQDSGFTLIELLIVVVILGVLSAIVVFAVGSTGKNAASAACQTDTKSVETALEAYKAETTAYPTDITALVTAQYLRGAPDSSHYSIATTSGKGDVIVTPLPSGTAVTMTPGGLVTAATACAGVN
jgi:prepilin-type N-terminal cleavage/methylation domain-containing protein